MRWVVGIVVMAGAMSVAGCGNISNEMLYYEAYWNAEAALEHRLGTKNPLSADHPLSMSKPDMTPRALPVSSTEDMYGLAVFDATFSFPVFAPVEEDDFYCTGTPTRSACMKDESHFAFICHHMTYCTNLDPHSELAESRAKDKIPADVHLAYAEFNELTPWDRVVRILNADAEGLKRSHSIGQRKLTVTLLRIKPSFYPTTLGAPLHYYESPHLKCLLGGPDIRRTTSRQFDKSLGPEFDAIISDPTGHYVMCIRFGYSADCDPNEAADRTLEFIGQCRFKQEGT